MKSENKKGWQHLIVKILHYPTAITLILIGLILSVLMFYNIYLLVIYLVKENISNKAVIEKVFIIFLQIEVVAAIKIYFNQNFHFPLRFLIYIGITDILRHIIMQVSDAKKLLIYTIALVLAIGALCLHEIKNNWVQRHKAIEDNSFEL